jgi:hypothetical protein
VSNPEQLLELVRVVAALAQLVVVGFLEEMALPEALVRLHILHGVQQLAQAKT